MLDTPEAAAAWLLTPEAVRDRCAVIFAAAQADRLDHFALREDRLAAVADLVVETIHQAYPDLAIPYHSRWRHFGAGGIERWTDLRATLADKDAVERGRLRFDLAVTSVLLDAGAGADWHYRDRDGAVYARSEGLGVASFAMFTRGLFSNDPTAPLRADATALEGLSSAALAEAFQITGDNPMVGLAGRHDLLLALGQALREGTDLFGAGSSGAGEARVGHLFDYLMNRAAGGRLPAREILIAVLKGLGSIWPGRETLAGVNLGDTWRHPAIRSQDARQDLVPFHKLSQWLSYSLVEPLEEEGGLTVTGLDRMTGLAEYRNGGLFIDGGVLVLNDPAAAERPHRPDAPLIVEWRALTLILLDRVAAMVREKLGLDEASFPLAKVLEGGTWAAGRVIAAEKRPGGPPPLSIISDGAVF